MLDIRNDATVVCTDGKADHVVALIFNPVNKALTHIVVGDREHRHLEERLVPLSYVADATPDRVQLTCTHAELEGLDSFVETRYVHHAMPSYGGLQGGQYMSPYTTEVNTETYETEIEAIPHGELAVHRGAHVEATDGQIGSVGEFIVEADSGHVTHVVLEEGHLWRKREIAVPVNHIQQILGDVVYLDLDKDAVEALPEPSLVRHYDQS